MSYFLNNYLSKKQKIRLYRICLLLDDMDFGYLRPVSLGTVLFCLVYIGFGYLPYLNYLTSAQIWIYSFLLLFVAVAFTFYLIPYVRKIRAKIRVQMNRRRKRATFTLFV